MVSLLLADNYTTPADPYRFKEKKKIFNMIIDNIIAHVQNFPSSSLAAGK